MANITQILYRRELLAKKHGKENIWMAVQMLEDLLDHEWCFDHDSLYSLHLMIRNLVLKCPRIRTAVTDQIYNWNVQKFESGDIVPASHVFLLNYIRCYLSESELQELNMLTDEIRQYGN